MARQVDTSDKAEIETTSHEWDGIKELDTPLPRWWLWSFYACIVFAIGYCVAYPAIPLAHRATEGVLHWTSHGQLATEQAKVEAGRAGFRAAIANTPIERVPPNSQMMQSAIEGGRAAFKVNCAQCHGTNASGRKGFPNLTDDDWLWGGDIKTIRQTLEHGVRQPGDKQTRMSQMPAFGRDGILTADQIQDAVSYVRFISHQERASPSARRGADLFANNCAACHGAQGKGNRQFGAPNLTDAIWLYGGDRETITETVTNARYGVMPAWNKKLDKAELNMLAAYVHSLGGGE
jgi:cytochrome c oxidase cbb3-type subunit 3